MLAALKPQFAAGLRSLSSTVIAARAFVQQIFALVPAFPHAHESQGGLR
jgi:hypothetical protein